MTDTQQQPSDEPIGYVSAGWAEHRVGHATVYPQPIKRVATYPVYAAPAQADSAPIAPSADAVEMILRDVCETDPADPDLMDTVCISTATLQEIVERHVSAAPTPIAPTADAQPAMSAQSGEPDIKALVNRFLAWPLPQTVAADGCATNSSYAFPRSGTNLLNADEAEAMLRYVTEGAPTGKVTADASSVPQFDYQRTFNAIADAVDSHGGDIGISVAKFVKSFNAASSAVEQTASDAIDVRAAAQWTPASMLPDEHGPYLCVVRHPQASKSIQEVVWFDRYMYCTEDGDAPINLLDGQTFDELEGTVSGIGWNREEDAHGGDYDMITVLYQTGRDCDPSISHYMPLPPMPEAKS